tara:strand:- start:175 stop:456 length:282 start_codon:yes stop_codon:yes gene_type:complete
MSIREYRQLYDCDDCETEFKVGDLVRCLVDPLYLTESKFDCGKYTGEVGLVTNVAFFKEFGLGMGFVICELEIYWGQSHITSYHLDKYIEKIV